MAEYDPLKFYRETYGDLSPYATSASKKKEPIKTKKLVRSNPIIYFPGFAKRRREASCDRKIRYETEQKALETANRVETIKKDGIKRYVYSCIYCEGFHTTRQAPKI